MVAVITFLDKYKCTQENTLPKWPYKTDTSNFINIHNISFGLVTTNQIVAESSKYYWSFEQGF